MVHSSFTISGLKLSEPSFLLLLLQAGKVTCRKQLHCYAVNPTAMKVVHFGLIRNFSIPSPFVLSAIFLVV